MRNNIIENIIGELKKTKWPTWKEVLMLAIYTLILCGIITLFILGLDLLFRWVGSLFGLSLI
jgi:preprotein translocase SecE subunit